MRIHIHIGTHKTGSTSLQAFLAQNRGVLGNLGYLFPKTDKADHANHSIAWQLREGDERGLRTVVAHAKSKGMSSVVLSSEDFELLRDLRRIRSLTAEFSTSIIVYLRPQLSYIESEYNQVVKMLPSRFSGSVEDLVSQPQYVYRFDYSRLIEPWSEAFGVESIKVRPFEKRQLCGDLYTDFLLQIGMSADAMGAMDHRVVKRNTSLDYEPLQLLLALNRFPLPDSLHAELVHALQGVEGSRRHLLSRQSACQLADRFAFSNQQVADKYLHRRGAPLFLEPSYGEADLFEDPTIDRPSAVLKALSRLQDQQPGLLQRALGAVASAAL